MTWRNRLLVPLLAAFGLLAVVVGPPHQGASASSANPPFGYVAGRSSTTLVNNIGDSEVVISPLTPLDAFLPISGQGPNVRQVKFTATIRVQATSPSTVNGYIDIYPGGCPTCTRQRIAGSTTYLVNAGGAGSETMVITGHALISTGPWTVEVLVKRAVGAGTVAVSSTTGTPQQILVEDMGV